ncbi:MAG: TorF family putative porin [Verrucomicrobiota bacterium]
MKKTAIVLAALVAGSVAQAQESTGSSLSVSLDTTFVSDYVFRGASLGNASIQPSIEASYGDLYAGLWFSNNLNNTAGDPTETDLYVGYGFALTDTISLDVGVTRYIYDGGNGADETEVYAGASFDVLLSPSVYYYYNLDTETSAYIGSIGYSLPVEAIGTSLDFTGTYGYIQNTGLVVGSEDYTYGSVGVSVPYALSDTATLTVGVEYIVSDSDTLRTESQDDIIVGSVGVSIGF